jgi:hypothetical protein
MVAESTATTTMIHTCAAPALLMSAALQSWPCACLHTLHALAPCDCMPATRKLQADKLKSTAGWHFPVQLITKACPAPAT